MTSSLNASLAQLLAGSRQPASYVARHGAVLGRDGRCYTHTIVRGSVAHRLIRVASQFPERLSVALRTGSGTAVRKVAIPLHIIADIERHLAEHCQPGPHGPLFSAADGGHLGTTTLYQAYCPARAKAGRPDLRFHDLRHTGMTLAGAARATLADLMAIAGRSTVSAAMIYQHSAADDGQEIASRLSDMAAGTVAPIKAARRRA